MNRLTAKLGSTIPSFKVRSADCHRKRLTAAVSNFGGLGSFGANSLAPEAIRDVIAEIREHSQPAVPP